jgi:hypothetical protein
MLCLTCTSKLTFYSYWFSTSKLPWHFLLVSNPPLAAIKEFSTSWLNTPNSITYDARNDRYITTLGTPPSLTASKIPQMFLK